MPSFDVVIVGAGPAGLSGALILGRCRRSVRVFDAGRPRNASSSAVWGFLSRDGVAPAELLRAARQELSAYPNVELCQDLVLDIEKGADSFRVVPTDGE